MSIKCQGRGVQDVSIEKAAEYAATAMALIGKANAPPLPRYYDLFFTYVSGTDPALSAKVAEVLRQSHPTISELEKLCEVRAGNDASGRVASVTDRVASSINSVGTALESAMSFARGYSSSLSTATDRFQRTTDAASLVALAQDLGRQTERMEEANSQLLTKLDGSSEDIATLKRELDEVRAEVNTDALTGIFNRKYFDEALPQAIVDARATGTQLAVTMLDIDNFKAFNDRWGHQTGDQVLRLVGGVLKTSCRQTDVAVRLGGEEFVVIMANTSLGGAAIAAGKIREELQRKVLRKRSTNENLGRVTASFGVALLRPDDDDTSLVERADMCLYHAKNSGRNCVRTERDPMLAAGSRSFSGASQVQDHAAVGAATGT